MTPQLIGYAIEELMGDSYHSYYLSQVRYFSEPQRYSSQFIRIRTPTAGSIVGNFDDDVCQLNLPPLLMTPYGPTLVHKNEIKCSDLI